MKQLFSIFIITAMTFACNTYAQDERKTNDHNGFMIGLTGGLSLRGGNYVKTDYSDPKSGFAGNGYNVGIAGTWLIKKSFGVTALVSYHQYSVQGLQHLADGFKEDFDIDSSTVKANGSNYSINILVGPYYSVPLSGKFFIDAHLLAGITSAHLAGYRVDVEDQQAATFAQKEAAATALAIQAGAEIRYNITSKIGLALGADYFYSKPGFTVSNENRNNNAGRLITKYNEPVSGLNTNLTLAYLLK